MMLPTLRVKSSRPPLDDGRENLRARRAVEKEGVGAVLAFDDIAAVAGVPYERVAAAAEKSRVVALIAVDGVIAVTAEQGVGAVAAVERVIADAAVERELHQSRQGAPGEGVVAAEAVDDKAVVGRFLI